MTNRQLSKQAERTVSASVAVGSAFRPRLVRVETPRPQEEIEAKDRPSNSWGAPAGRAVAIEAGQGELKLVPFHTHWPGAAHSHLRRSFRESAKRVFDIGGGIVLGLAFLPLMLLIALLLRSEGGPVIYRHRRIGRDGRLFDCLKFRTMVPDADRKLRELLEDHPELEEEWLRDHKLRTDPRITAIGRFLRRTSLDELPQIWNVLRGEMSLVGPRPIVREETMRYGRCLPLYLSARPGITGLWQVTGRNDTDYRRRVALDVYYVRKKSALLDLYILLKTTRVILGGGGAY